MTKHTVSIVRYEEPYKSVKKAVDLCGGLNHLPARAKIFIKPNIDSKGAIKSLREAGIAVDPVLFDQFESFPGFFMPKYQDRQEFGETFFRIQ